MIDFENYNRNAFAVEAVQVTAEAMEEIAREFNRRVETEAGTGRRYISMSTDDGRWYQESQVEVGDWLLRTEDERIAHYKGESFRNHYTQQSEQQAKLTKVLDDLIAQTSVSSPASEDPVLEMEDAREQAAIAITGIFIGE